MEIPDLRIAVRVGMPILVGVDGGLAAGRYFDRAALDALVQDHSDQG